MINIRMQHKEVQKLSPKITVLGVGGAGGNAVNNMISAGLLGCSFVVCNTDAQALENSLCETKIQLGETVTAGLGAGAKPEIGRAAAEETIDEIAHYLEGSNMAFITAGMGGGTGTGAAPVIARACRELGVLTVGVVTKPFHFEGSHRMRQAELGIEQMQEYVDTLIVIPNQNLFRIANEKTTFAEAFRMADSVLQSGVRGVTDLMVMPGLINLDFADIRSAMLEMGKAMMGTGEAQGDRRAVESAEAAINNPLLDDVSMKGARGVIINVTGGMDMTLFEVDEACNRIKEEVDPNANIIFGSTFDEALEGIMRVSVVATGIDAEIQRQAKPVPNASINNVTAQQQQERKLERAQPNTASQPAQKPVEKPVAAAKIEAPVYTPATHIPAAGPMTAPNYATAMAAARKPEEPENEMFEQQAFEAVPVPAAPRAQPQPQYQQHQYQQPVPQQGVPMRGTIYNNSFIPPRPVEPEYARPETGYGPDLGGPLVARKQSYQQTEFPVQSGTTPGLTLKPPVPGGGGSRKKPPTLFERFTTPRWPLGQKEEKQGETSSSSGSGQGSSSGGGAAPVMRAPQRDMQQGSLAIESPRGVETEEELDIPAFLRRQAN